MIEQRKPVFATWNPIVWVLLNGAIALWLCQTASVFSRLRDDFDESVPSYLRTAPWEKVVLNPFFVSSVGIVLVLFAAFSIRFAPDRVSVHKYCKAGFAAGWGVFGALFVYASYMPVLAW